MQATDAEVSVVLSADAVKGTARDIIVTAARTAVIALLISDEEDDWE